MSETMMTTEKLIIIDNVRNGNRCTLFTGSYHGYSIAAGKCIKGSPPSNRNIKPKMNKGNVLQLEKLKTCKMMKKK